MRYEANNRINCLIIALLIAAVIFVMPQAASAVTVSKAKSKAVSTTSVKVSWSLEKKNTGKDKKKDPKIVQWKVYRATVQKSGKSDKYQEVKTLKKDKCSCTVKKLKPDTKYRFWVIGYSKEGGKLTRSVSAVTENYTGIADPSWAAHASTDYKFSPQMIELALQTKDAYGLQAGGYQIYRIDRSDKNGKYEKVAAVKDSDKDSSGIIRYQDKDVKGGRTYQYRVRAYRTEKVPDKELNKDKKDKKKEKTKKKTSYSRFSGALTMSAINKKGTFKIKKRALTSKRLEIRMDSQKYNADLLLSQHDTFYGDEKQYEDPIVIRQWSKDGKSWKKLEMLTPMQEASGKKPAEGVNYIRLKGGSHVYLRFGEVINGTDIRDLGKSFSTDEVTYNKQTYKLVFSLSGKGSCKQQKKREAR